MIYKSLYKCQTLNTGVLTPVRSAQSVSEGLGQVPFHSFPETSTQNRTLSQWLNISLPLLKKKYH